MRRLWRRCWQRAPRNDSANRKRKRRGLNVRSLDDPRMECARLMLEAEMHLDTHNFEAVEDAAGPAGDMPVATSRRSASSCARSRVVAIGQRCCVWCDCSRSVMVWRPQLAQELKCSRRIRRTSVRQQADLGQLLDYLRQLPARENSPRLARLLAEALIEQAAHDQAQQLIEGQLDVQWDSGLVRLYGQLPGRESISCIARAEQWLPEHPEDPQLLLALGRLCLKQRLWGKAQSYLEASLSLAEQRETRLELARLFEQTERPEEAMPHYRAAAEQPA
jgi:HemY protein